MPQFARILPVVIPAAVLVWVAASGCSLIPRTAPVSRELATARRLSNEGLTAADQQDLGRAESLFERAVRACPTDVDARRHFAEVLWKRGERVAAVGQIAEALEIAPHDEELCVVGGRMYLELGLLDDADRLASAAVSLAPRSARAWQLRGQAALARGRLDDALDDFHRGLAIEPDNRQLLYETAEAYRQANRPTRALATLAVLEETYGPGQTPGDVLALEGLAQEALGRGADALESYRLAMSRGNAPQDLPARIAALEQQERDTILAGRETRRE